MADYNYDLPEERIAKFPLKERSSSKLLVYRQGEVSEDSFRNIVSYLPQDPLMVFNNTKVIQARLRFRKETGSHIEVFLLEPATPSDYQVMFSQRECCVWHCLIGNLKKWKDGSLTMRVETQSGVVTVAATKVGTEGTFHNVEFRWDNPDLTFTEWLEAAGEIPIPPYLNREPVESDKTTYQTVYSKIKGSVAAPTAGLHFTDDVMKRVTDAGIEMDYVTLHVGAGTFRPVKSEEISGHEMHTEFIAVKRGTIERLVAHGGRATAVGTTSVRTLESLYYIGIYLSRHPDAAENELLVEQWAPYSGLPEMESVTALGHILSYMERNSLEVLKANTQIIIVPGYKFRVVCAMVTNFHQPQSTLLLLVSAFTKGEWRGIYDYALSHDFRFLSYGDSSILLP